MTSQYKKKIKPGLIELDPTQPTIIVHLTNQLLDNHNLTPEGQPTLISTTAEQRRFKLKTFSISSNVSKFAAVFVSKCELIHESKTKHIEALLTQLQERMKEEEATGGGRDDGDEFDRFDETGSPDVVSAKDRLNSTAPHSFQPSSRGGKLALNSTAPLSIHTRGRDMSAASEKEEDEEKQADTPLTPLTPATPKEPRGGRASAAKVRDRDEEEDRTRTSKRRTEDTSRKTIRARDDDDEEREERKSRESDTRERQSPTKSGKSSRSQRDADDDDDGRPIRSDSRNSASSTDSNRPPTRKPNPSSSSSSSSSSASLARAPRQLPHAQLDEIDSYIEQLYDDIPAKVQASGCLLALVSNPQHLPYFVDTAHSQVLEIVSRVLSEDRKKSNELVLNIMELFYVLSGYSQLHPLVLSNRIGDTSMKVITLELKRYEVRVEEEKDKPKYKKQGKLSKELTSFLQKQNRLLGVCFELLYHLSEDVLIEMKMKQRDLIKTLIQAVERTVTILAGWSASAGSVEGLDELTGLVLLFLKKLSIFEENKTEMSAYKLCAALAPLLPSASPPAGASSAVSPLVQEAALRLLYNLSFDGGERAQMMRCGYVAGCGAVLRRGVRSGELRGDSRRLLAVAVRLLYSVSMDGQWRDAVSGICSELVGDLVQLVVDWPTKHVDTELIALLVNVTFPSPSASASPYATALCPITTDDMHLLLKRAQQTVDPLLFKFIHHLTVHYPELSPALSRYAADLLSLSAKCVSSLDLSFDLLGLIASLPGDSSHNYADLLSQYNYLSLITKLVSPTFEHPDLRLAALGALSTLISTDASTRRLGSSGALSALLALTDRTDCLDTAVQCMYTIYRIVRWGGGRRLVCDSERGLDVVVGRLEDEVQSVRELALLCCDEMSSESVEWAERIKQIRFERFNRLWLDRVGNVLGGGRPKTAGKTKTLLRARNGSRRRSRSGSRSRSRSPSL